MRYVGLTEKMFVTIIGWYYQLALARQRNIWSHKRNESNPIHHLSFFFSPPAPRPPKKAAESDLPALFTVATLAVRLILSGHRSWWAKIAHNFGFFIDLLLAFLPPIPPRKMSKLRTCRNQSVAPQSPNAVRTVRDLPVRKGDWLSIAWQNPPG